MWLLAGELLAGKWREKQEGSCGTGRGLMTRLPKLHWGPQPMRQKDISFWTKVT